MSGSKDANTVVAGASADELAVWLRGLQGNLRNEADRAVDRMSKEAREVETRLGSLVGSWPARVEAVKKDNGSLRRQVAVLQAELQRAKQAAEEARTAREGAEQRAREVGQQTNPVRVELAASEEKRRQLEEHIKAWVADSKKWKEERRSLLDAASREIAKRKEAETTAEMLRDRLSRAEALTQSVEHRLSAMSNEKEGVERTKDELRAKLEQARQQAENARAEQQKAIGRADFAHENARRLFDENQTLAEENKAIRSEIDALRALSPSGSGGGPISQRGGESTGSAWMRRLFGR